MIITVLTVISILYVVWFTPDVLGVLICVATGDNTLNKWAFDYLVWVIAMTFLVCKAMGMLL